MTAPVYVRSVGGFLSGSTGPLTLSLDLGSGNNRCLVVLAETFSPSVIVPNGATAGGVSMNAGTGFVNASGSTRAAKAFWLGSGGSLPTGTQNIVISFTGSTSVLLATAVLYSGTDDTTPLSNLTNCTAADAAPTGTGTSAVGNTEGFIFETFVGSNTATPTSPSASDAEVSIGSQTVSVWHRAGASSTQSVVGTISGAGNEWAGVAFNLHATSGAASQATFSGPSSGGVNAASSNFTLSVDTTPITGTLVVTPHSDKAGTFSPSNVSLTTGSPTATVQFTPTVSGVHSITITNNGGLSNQGAQNYTVQPAVTYKLVTSPTDNTPIINQTNIKGKWFDDPAGDSASAPVHVFSSLTSDASGNGTVALPNSTLTNGQSGRLDLTSSDGATIGSDVLAVT